MTNEEKISKARAVLSARKDYYNYSNISDEQILEFDDDAIEEAFEALAEQRREEWRELWNEGRKRNQFSCI